MILKKFRSNGRILIGKADKDSAHVFKHCNNGSPAATVREYNSVVERLIFTHGVNYIKIIDESRRKGRTHA